MKKYFTRLLPVIGILIFTACSSTRTTTENSVLTNKLQSKNYTFAATEILPMEDARYNMRNLFPNAGNLYQLTSGYDLRVTPDSVIAYLPFYGRAYSAPMNTTEGGIKFTSTKFTYKTYKAKGRTEIEIAPQDTHEVNRVYLSISPDGYGVLRINSNTKSPVAYYGNIGQ